MEIPLQHKELKNTIDRVMKDIKAIRKNKRSRQDFLLTKHEQDIEMDNCDRVKVIKYIMKVEARLESYRTY